MTIPTHVAYSHLEHAIVKLTAERDRLHELNVVDDILNRNIDKFVPSEEERQRLLREKELNERLILMNKAYMRCHRYLYGDKAYDSKM